MDDSSGLLLRNSRADVLACAVIVLIGSTLVVGLGYAPMYIGGDEAQFTAHAYSLASRGRDLNGRLLPVFFNIADPLRPSDSSGIWYQPMLFYLMALVLKILPVSESTVRLPTAIIGILDGLLMYAIGRRLFAHRTYALLAALMLLLSPAHFIFSRQALDYICPLPFVLGWLWCLVALIQTDQSAYLFAGGSLLGVGVFAYIASWATMSLYFVATLVVVWRSRAGCVRKLATVSLGFLLPLLVPGIWLWVHPGMLGDTLARYGLRMPGVPLSPHTSYSQISGSVIERISVYWAYFDPSYLFFSGGSNPTMATRRAGVFLLTMSPFLARGLCDLWQRRSALNAILLFGFASAPCAVVATLPPSAQFTTGRALSVLPFGVLVSLFGAAMLLRHATKGIRLLAILLVLAMPIQFGYFLHEYFTEYRLSSADRFDPINIRAVADYVISADTDTPVPAVYLSDELDDGAVRWKFYMLKYQRDDLWQRTYLFAPDQIDLTAAPVGSLFVTDAADPQWSNARRDDTFPVVSVVVNALGLRSAAVLRKSR